MTNEDLGASVVEEYEFLRLYSIDLERSRQSLHLISTVERAELRHALLEVAVVAYARPFSTNRGKHIRRHSLSMNLVPAEARRLHGALIALRDQVFAHTDHEFRNPLVGRFPLEGDRHFYPMSFTNPAWDDLMRDVPQIERLVVAVESAVNARIEGMNRQFDMAFAWRAARDGAQR